MGRHHYNELMLHVGYVDTVCTSIYGSQKSRPFSMHGTLVGILILIGPRWVPASPHVSTWHSHRLRGRQLQARVRLSSEVPVTPALKKRCGPPSVSLIDVRFAGHSR